MPESENSPKEMSSSEKQAMIREIVDRNRVAFMDWADKPENKRSLVMPQEVLRFFIPQRLLEVVSDPTAVDVVKDPASGSSMLGFMFVEHTGEPLSDQESVEREAAEYTAWRESIKSGAPILYLPAFDNIHPVHQEHFELLRSEIIDVRDLITHEIDIYKITGDLIYVGGYADNAYPKRGITTEFYKRLHQGLGKLGFRFIIGSNNEENIDFFTNTLGRVRLSHIRPELQQEFDFSLRHEDNPDYNTVDFLDPKDRAAYLLPDKQ